MSFASDLKTALVAMLRSTLGDDWRYLDRYEAIRDTDYGRMPLAMVFGAASSTEQLEFQQQEELTSLTVVLLRRGGEENEMLTDVESVAESLRDDPDLSLPTEVWNSWFSDTVVDPTLESQTIAVMTFVAKRITD